MKNVLITNYELYEEYSRATKKTFISLSLYLCINFILCILLLLFYSNGMYLSLTVSILFVIYEVLFFIPKIVKKVKHVKKLKELFSKGVMITVR